MADTGHLSPEGRVRALSAMRRFSKLAEGMGLTELTAVATAAVRDATDGRDFCEEVRAQTGIKIWVIDGEEEARLSAQGVLLGWPGAVWSATSAALRWSWRKFPAGGLEDGSVLRSGP